MILTVTPNPAIDVTVAAAHLRFGATHHVPASVRRAGGKGLNVARVLAQVGAPVVATALIGGADTDWFAADLPCAFQPVLCDGSTRLSFALHDESTAQTTMFNEVGQSRSAAEWAALVQSVGDVPDLECVTVSGSVPPETPPGAIAAVVHAALARGAVVIADLVGDALLEAIAAGAHIVKPNAAELERTLGAIGVRAGAAALLERGARLAVVSDGERGMRGAFGTPVQEVTARMAAPLRGNATGAGDAAVAALGHAVVAERRGSGDFGADFVLRALRLAAGWSAAAVLEPVAGTMHPSFAELASSAIVDFEPRSSERGASHDSRADSRHSQ